ncbi:restriction endonuclease subunit S [Acinetobacter sp. ANC 4862]|uniref:restriction endonuclease subunit S n=1 Tax=Acinetobacter sp. ANC 4862 TaxID=2529849 RepID=UPI00103EE25A|nr:restriction endonuclease subunit S [Acinetobacter sp. ANC 4862]TCH62495.1 restriction endonuclease subunit S [Acinetobacter sp. ANC 4862]
MVAPKLRFKEFNDDWSLKKLGDISFKPQYGMNSSATEFDGENKYLRITDINEDDHSFNFSKLTSPDDDLDDKYLLKNGDLLFARTGASVGKSYLYNSKDGKVYFAGFLIKFSLHTNVNPYFIFTQTLSKKFQNWVITNSMRSGQPGINAEEYSSLPITFTSLEEQTKIASFFSTVDEKISQLSQKLHLLGQYKQGMMQKLFSQQIRFKADDGSEFRDWEDKPLNEIACKNTIKNKDGSITEVLTNSATQGIIKQSDYFEREIVTESNLTGYYLVNVNDFVYNPRISVHAPVGPIKRNKKCLGIMSPLYTVFTIKTGNLNYLEYFFDCDFWHDYVKSVANSGARHDRMNITNKDFFEMPILYPCLEEQTKIANFLSSIDQKIDVVSEQLEQAKLWKKGLLQQMFV